MIRLPASTPPATLSEAMWDATFAPLAERSRVRTGTWFRVAARTAAFAVSESTGLSRMAFTFWSSTSSTLDSSLAGSFSLSRTTRSYPSSFAFALAPLARETKNGLLRVDITRAILSAAAAMPDDATTSTPARIITSNLLVTVDSFPKQDAWLVGPPLPVDQNRKQDYGALRDHLIVGRDVEQIERIVQDADDQGADESSGDAADSAGEARAANDHSGDGVKLIALPSRRLRALETRRENDPGDRRQ